MSTLFPKISISSKIAYVIHSGCDPFRLLRQLYVLFFIFGRVYQEFVFKIDERYTKAMVGSYKVSTPHTQFKVQT